MKVSDLWSRYSHLRWLRILHCGYFADAEGKDFDTIRYWIKRFKEGATTEIVLGQGCVADGNHRLVAAKLAGVEEIGVLSAADAFRRAGGR